MDGIWGRGKGNDIFESVIVEGRCRESVGFYYGRAIITHHTAQLAFYY